MNEQELSMGIMTKMNFPEEGFRVSLRSENMVGRELGQVQGSWQMRSEEDSTREESMNWIIQPNTGPVWLWKSIFFPLTIPVLAHFNCTVLSCLKETDLKSNPVREESSMAFGTHKSTHFIFQSRTPKSYLLLKDSCHAPVAPGSSPPPDSVFFTAALQRSSPLSPASYDFILSASESQGKLWRLTAWASC